MKSAISGEEALEDFLSLFNDLNAMADGELGFVVRYALEAGNPFYDISEYHIKASSNLLVEIMNDSELANATEEFGAIVEHFNHEDKLDYIENSAAYKWFCKIFHEQAVGLMQNYLNYLIDSGINREIREMEPTDETFVLYHKLVEKYNA